MRGYTITETQTLVTEVCCNCHVLFAITEGMQQKLRNTHDWFYCPNGHSQHYTGKSEKDKLREIERQLASRHLTRAKKKIGRVEKGTCPHCRRHFVNVERHMTTKHSEHTHD